MGLFDIFSKKQVNVNNAVETRPQDVDITRYIDYRQNVYRITTDMAKYKRAVESAENYQYPSRTPLYEIYIGTVMDAHLSAVWEQRKNLTLRKDFCIKGANDEKSEDKTALIKRKWFYDFLNLALESKAWGHSLIQLGDFDNSTKEFLNIELVPRQYVNPPKHIVTKTQYEQTGVDYTQPEYKDWLIEVGDRWDLGILMKAAPYIIWKKNALGAWAEYQEAFGVPLRIGKTNSTDVTTVNNMQNFLSNFGLSKWGLFKKDDLIEIHETSNSDAYNVFDKMIDKVNAEISKLYLGQTGTTDEKAYSGSAEVHERVLDTYEEADEHFIMSVLNYSLKPILVRRGIMSNTDYFGYEEDESIDVLDKIKIDAELLKYYTLSPEYIKETYGTDVEMKEVTQMTDYKNKLDEYYGK